MGEVQRLNGRINILNKFISKMDNKCKSFFHLLKTTMKTKVAWTTKCDTTFTNMKKLASLSLLMSPRLGEKLLLRIATSKDDVSAVLINQRKQKQKQILIYYHSHNCKKLNYATLRLRKL